MAELASISEDAHKWLEGHPKELWARHLIGTKLKSDHVTNNIAESFNSWINKVRGNQS